MKETLAAQVNLRPNYEQDNTVVDYDDLWVKTPETYSTAPGVYTRGAQESEIDELWSGLRETHATKTSPVLYLGVGFATGLVVAFIISTILFWGTGNKTNAMEIPAVDNPIVEQTQSDIKVPKETLVKATPSQQNYKGLVNYTIQSGDSLGLIAEKFYKSSSPEYVKLIQKANNLKSEHTITAGKKLLIPVKE